MKKFHFPLEAVARVRGLNLRSREIELAHAQEAKKKAEEVRRRQEERLRRSLSDMPRGAVVPVHELLRLDAEVRRCERELKEKERVLAQQSARVEEERDRVVEAKRGVEAVGKLRERLYAEYLRQWMREEQRNTDEAAARRVQEKKAA